MVRPPATINRADDWEGRFAQAQDAVITHIRWAGPLGIAAAAFFMLWWSWGTWPDVIVDFGRELYIPWRLSEGEALYRDLAYYNGPLSPYVNSLWFRLFGTSLRVLALANFAILGLLLCLAYRLLAEIGSRTAATIGCLVFVSVFGFSRYLPAGNYNYICPYSHELTHGLALALSALFFVGQFTRGGQLRYVALCGLCVGLALLTKPEIALATAPSAVVGVALSAAAQKVSPARALQIAAVFLVLALVPTVIAIAWLAHEMPAGEALSAVLAAYWWIFSPAINASEFYENSMGVRNSGAHLSWLAVTSLWYGLYLGLPPLVVYIDWAPRKVRMGAALAVVAVLTARLWWVRAAIPIADIARPLPLLLLAGLGSFVALWMKRSEKRLQLVLPIVLLLFSLLLLGKLLLFVRVVHYGFCLALPATMVSIVLLWNWLPPLLDRHGSSATVARAALLATLAVLVVNFLEIAGEAFRSQTTIVGSGTDAFRAAGRAPEVNRLLAAIGENVSADGTLAILPEGAMLNYLSRRRNSTRFVSLMPVELTIFGEDNVLADFQAHPPDFVIRTNENLEEYDLPQLGKGYAERLVGWLDQHYAGVGEGISAESKSLQGQLFRRRPVSDGASARRPAAFPTQPAP